MAYTSATNISDYLGRSLSTKETDFFSNVLGNAVDDYINSYTGVTFYTGSAPSASTKYYSGEGGRYLDIDKCTDITAVEYIDQNADGDTNEELDLGDDYLPYPLNNSVTSQLLLRSRHWSRGHKNIKITAKFGEPLPDKLALAATMLSATFLSSDKNLQSESIEGYSRTFSQITQDSTEISELLNFHTDPVL